jgi:hypothetical protein
MGLAVLWASPWNGWIFECSIKVVQQCQRAPSQRERGDSHRLTDCFLVRSQHGRCHPWRRNWNRSDHPVNPNQPTWMALTTGTITVNGGEKSGSVHALLNTNDQTSGTVQATGTWACSPIQHL